MSSRRCGKLGGKTTRTSRSEAKILHLVRMLWNPLNLFGALGLVISFPLSAFGQSASQIGLLYSIPHM